MPFSETYRLRGAAQHKGVMMDISFSTIVGGSVWSLAECAAWVRENDFDATHT